LADGGDIESLRDFAVVEAYDRKILRHTYASSPAFVQHSGREDVLVGEDRVREPPLGQHLLDRGVSARDVVTDVDVAHLVGVDTGVDDGATEAVSA
jgi:hypothetical protein